jgi:hypothetical protein
MTHRDTGGSAPVSRFRVDHFLVEALLQTGDADEAEIPLDRIRVFLETRDWPISQIGLHRIGSLQLISKGDPPTALIASTSAVDLAARHHRRGDHLLVLLQRACISTLLRTTGSASRSKLIARVIPTPAQQ